MLPTIYPALLVSLGILVVALLLAPSIAYLYTGWFYRQEEIVAGMSEKAMMLYFRQFHPHYQVDQGEVTKRFRAYYRDQFGRRHHARLVNNGYFESVGGSGGGTFCLPTCFARK